MDDLYIGLMSGTSVDGIDAVLVNFNNDNTQILQTHSQSFPDEIRNRLQQLIMDQKTSLQELAELDYEVAVLYTLAVKKLLQLAGKSAIHVKAIGAHGQTIYHQAEGGKPNSLQIGNPSFLAEHTGIDVVADFRRHDMAAGGQGAPLVPAFHHYVFYKDNSNRVILNLGGIANITVLPSIKYASVRGFDTGPANTLLDLWSRKKLNKGYDENGSWASSGSIQADLLNRMLDDAYFKRPPPKSTGREYFNQSWLEQFSVNSFDPADIQATLAELTAQSIAKAIDEHAIGTSELFVCGGGVHNTYLMSRLRIALPSINIASTEELGLLPDWIEATAFAWLARQTLHNRAGNICSVTGAQREVPLGGIYHAG